MGLIKRNGVITSSIEEAVEAIQKLENGRHHDALATSNIVAGKDIIRAGEREFCSI